MKTATTKVKDGGCKKGETMAVTTTTTLTKERDNYCDDVDNNHNLTER